MYQVKMDILQCNILFQSLLVSQKYFDKIFKICEIKILAVTAIFPDSLIVNET